jgi:AcrR family transcriptional regulator
MKINAAVISETALDLLEETGLDGLSMRVVAARLGVRPGTLYWHVKNKQELLESMAGAIFADAAEGLEAPRAGVSWQDWLADWVRRLRRAMLRRPDGAKIFAGSSVKEPALFRATELTLRTLQDAGFAVQPAARSVAALLHYTVGFTMEEQAHSAAGTVDQGAHAMIDDERFPLTAQAYARDDLFDPDTDDCFEYGLATIIRGMQAMETPGEAAATG